MTNTTDLAQIAQALAEQARRFSQFRRELHDHPEQVHGILNNLVETIMSLDDIIEAADVAYRTNASTAVTRFGREAEGTVSAIYTAGLLKAASHSVYGLRDILMRAAAETDGLVWPQHDPIAAAELQEYREFLHQRAKSIEPDQDTPAASSRERSTIEPL